jgi:hypothetical protein
MHHCKKAQLAGPYVFFKDPRETDRPKECTNGKQ